ncbi:DNA polymerase III subunit delta' [Bathymodiolus platifrons methanotrophic gill symbiont]|uniref:DNA polymerase III subunit delta' n=1 Tax=Bathymodiolus platifrons methanotrophic gill symbiont TaxID=113268 RepID=UPI000B4113EE|nr:DNA polymerase III subunit delta' [Bathymodiolus platifrons methanotrophic gill symbiont]MCK5869143.1 DNA polymerase III subunit delta' [Methyloprofundus sp.]TXK97293.1 DNA polymerase III subunit delta' [Methylococcaceae bacterium CS4]TXK99165.1 DNA polymerase III subunit delta' [Methylococcaceae bacterium CS5]TXL08628.1 DNA polymerase III subunit delta' [Methylococcaceae bacterium CS1]TXL08729.1 DNA polymerase III subunit delta' [Methylococcaceae bacterium CS3]TXL12272.1 DNA polymerase II
MSDLIYPWHKPYWQHLAAYVEQQRIPQALLMNGVAGLGKQDLAMQFAQYLTCLDKQEKSYCGHCASCKLFVAGTHPDFTLLQPAEPGKVIGVDMIRQLIAKLVLKPQYSAYRVVIITPAEQMNINSANAFLKCLEEPPERTVFLLLTERSQTLPATIRSRCQKMLITAPDIDNAVLWLQSQGVNEQQKLLLHLAQGAPIKALAYAQDNVLEQRNGCFDDWEKVAQGQVCPVQLAEKWHKLPAGQLVQWLVSWTEDVIKCYFQAEKTLLLNEDLDQHLRGLAKRLDLNRLFDFYGLLLKDTYRINRQLNKQLLFEEMLIIWSQATINK